MIESGFVKFTENDLHLVLDNLSNFNFYPYRYITNKTDNVLNFWKEDIVSRFKRGSKMYGGGGKKLSFFALLEDLPWDSRIFNKKMGALTYLTFSQDISYSDSARFVSFMVSEARKEGYEFLLCKVNTDNILAIHSLEKNGFLIVDTLLDYIWNKNRNPLPEYVKATENVVIEPAKKEDESKLKLIASKAFSKHFGRYHSDPYISKNLANRVYEEWVSSCLNGYADFFFVAKVDGKIAGYSIWKRESEIEKRNKLKIGHYSIAGVDENYRGMGLFKILTFAGMKTLSKEVEIIEGPTHINNYPVQKGYGALGWKIGDARHSFHKWL